MGQCYSITMKLKFKNEEDVRKKLIEVMKSTDCTWTNVKWKGSLYDLLKAFTYVEADSYFVKTFRNGSREISLNSAFDQRYGWEPLLGYIFQGLESVLSNGSYMVVYPDSDYDRYVIKNNKCVQTH